MYKLLFVDDEERVLAAIRESVSWEALNVRAVGWCDNAISALQILINEHVDILITDIKMPVMDGLELINRAKEMQPSIECIILSGYEEFEYARYAIENGVRGYLLKPCRKEELEKKVSQCVKELEKVSHAFDNWREEQQKRIEKAYERFINIDIENTDNDYERVRQALLYSDQRGVLHETLTMIVMHEDVDLRNERALLNDLSQFSDSQALLERVVAILRQIAGDGIADPVVAKMISYTKEHFGFTGLTIQYLSQQVIHLSPKYIGKRFLKEMNMKYGDFLLNLRMEKAIEILRNESLTAEKIAESVGLGNNVSYFYRLFRQYTGMTFKNYKDSIS